MPFYERVIWNVEFQKKVMNVNLEYEKKVNMEVNQIDLAWYPFHE